MTLWRLGVSVALIAAVLRAGRLGYLLGDTAWYALQFGPLVLLGLIQLVAMIRARSRISRRALGVLIPAGLLVLAAAASLISAVDRVQTLRQIALLVAVLLFLLTTYAHRWSRAGALNGDLLTVFWVGAALQGFGVVGFVSGQTWAIGDYDRLIGFTPNANYAGILGAVLVALSFHFPGIWTKIGALAPLAALFLSDSRGSMIGLLVGLIVMLVASPAVRASRLEWICAGSTIVVLPPLFWLRAANQFSTLKARTEIGTVSPEAAAPGASVTPTPSDVTSGRLDIYRAFIDKWTERPWLGSGYRSSQVHLNGEVFEAHNVYLSILVETGVFGAVVLLALIIGMLRSAAPHLPLIGAAATVLAVEITESTLFGLGGPTALLSWLVLLGWAATGMNRPQADRPVSALDGADA